VSATISLRVTRRLVPSRAPRPPVPLIATAMVVAALAILPLLYLAWRAIDGGADALAPLLRPRTLELIGATVVLGVTVGAGAVGLGVPIAWLTARTDLPWRSGWAVLLIAPLAIPSYLLAFAAVAAFGPRGWIPSLLESVGVAGVPSVYGLGGTAIVLVLATTPYVILSTRAALARLDPGVEEAARSLGSSPLEAARATILPVIVPAVGAGALLAMLYAVSDFGSVSILRFDTLATAIYSRYRLSFDRSSAAALALLLVGLALLLVWAESRIRRRAALDVAHGRRRVAAPVRLGRWRWAALALCAGVASLSLAMPAVTIGLWLANGIARGLPLTVSLEPLRDSLVLGVSAALVAVVVSLPLAMLVSHHRGRWAVVTERLLYGIYAIPAICVALALVSFTLNIVPSLYQTLLALVVAVSLRYLIQPVGALRGPLLQVSPRTLDAARSLGEPPLGVIRTIVLPLLRPGLLAGAALVLLSALKELPLTLLLAPTGFSTLATQLWDAAREAFFAQASIPAAILLIVSLGSVGLLVRRGDLAS
jgi:iron(III) transport system permease protein